MKETALGYWKLEVTNPPNLPRHSGPRREYFGVVAESIEDAIMKAKLIYPDCRVISVNYGGNLLEVSEVKEANEHPNPI